MEDEEEEDVVVDAAGAATGLYTYSMAGGFLTPGGGLDAELAAALGTNRAVSAFDRLADAADEDEEEDEEDDDE